MFDRNKIFHLQQIVKYPRPLRVKRFVVGVVGLRDDEPYYI